MVDKFTWDMGKKSNDCYLIIVQWKGNTMSLINSSLVVCFWIIDEMFLIFVVRHNGLCMSTIKVIHIELGIGVQEQSAIALQTQSPLQHFLTSSMYERRKKHKHTRTRVKYHKNILLLFLSLSEFYVFIQFLWRVLCFFSERYIILHTIFSSTTIFLLLFCSFLFVVVVPSMGGRKHINFVMFFLPQKENTLCVNYSIAKSYLLLIFRI